MKRICSLIVVSFICAMFSASIAHADQISDVSDVDSLQPVPVYRLYTDINKEHLYTTDANEVNVLTTRGWVYEGVGWFAPSEGKPVYRLNNPELQNHLYTVDTNEVNELTTQHGWVKDFDGNALFYSAGDVEIYRVYNESLRGMHHMTTDANEYVTLAKPEWGWTQEGVKLKALCAGLQASEWVVGRNAAFETFPTETGKNISNAESYYTIEGDVALSGTGTGQQAMLVAQTATSSISFGIRYERNAEAPYTNLTTLVMESRNNNLASEPVIKRLQYALRDTRYHLMLTVSKSGLCKAYLDGRLIGQITNSTLGQQLTNNTHVMYLNVEGAGRTNGDGVDASFSDLKLKGLGTYEPSKSWYPIIDNNLMNAGLSAKTEDFASYKRIEVRGTVSGVQTNEDWNSLVDHTGCYVWFRE